MGGAVYAPRGDGAYAVAVEPVLEPQGRVERRIASFRARAALHEHVRSISVSTGPKRKWARCPRHPLFGARGKEGDLVRVVWAEEGTFLGGDDPLDGAGQGASLRPAVNE